MPRWFTQLRLIARSIFRKSSLDRELDEELQYHLQREIDVRMNAGLTPEEAHFAARRAMGAIAQSMEECRHVRRVNLVDDFLRDIRYAAFSLRRNPLVFGLIVLIMALGIGANTAVFGVINAVLLKPLPYSGADRIVTLSTRDFVTGDINPLVTIANYRDWRDQNSSFEAMATYRGGEYPVTSGSVAEYTQTVTVDIAFFRVFGVEPVIGRTFIPEEMASGSRAVVISYAYWQTRLGGDPRVLERTVRVGNDPRPIVGVMPAGFRFPRQTDIWGPQRTRSTSRTGHNFFAVARLKPGVSLERGQADLNTIAARLEQEYPASNKGRGVLAAPLQEELVRDVRLTLYLLWGVVGVVLLIACANTATLLLGKAMARTREIAVRIALGASRSRIIRQLVTESLLLALIAGAAGIVLAYWGVNLLAALTPSEAVRLTEIRIDGVVLSFTMAVSIAATVLFGLVPALHASKVDLTNAIKQAGRSMHGRRMVRTRGMLVVSEIALSVVLVTGAGLLIKSLIALHNVELGFKPGNVLVMKATGIHSRKENDAFFRSAMSRIASLPGVVAVGATSIPPGDLSNAGSGSYFIDWLPEQRERTVNPEALFTIVAPGIFEALGIPLKSGRDFNERDTGDSPLVAIVNEALVRKSFGNEDPIGRTIFCTFDRKDPMTIVGVVGDVRQRNPALAPMPECYMPYTQHSYNNATLYIVTRTAGDPSPLARPVLRIAAEISPNAAASVTTMEAEVSKKADSPRFRALLFAVLAVFAVCLAMAGVYGVIAYAVGQRTSEIGLRIALGASPGSVLQLVLGQGLVLAGIGLALGLAAAVASTRLLTTVLFQVQPHDVPVYVSVAILLALVTLLASYVPARRASRIDPMAALRQE